MVDVRDRGATIDQSAHTQPADWSIRVECAPHNVQSSALLARLVKKGALRFKAEGNRYIYRPALSREKFVRAETRTFLDRVFGGQATPMLVHFAENGDLTPEDLESLKEILERSRK